ncbi:MAG: hypothetical protein O3B95_09755 [Chloroflexi bacterium]|nr:hypothetical protein [Chloroflexota bacterium]
MFRRAINRLLGRTDPSIDAINAYVEGTASSDEVEFVEGMISENPALERDLATQGALLSVLNRIEKIEAPRSFAITPEMVTANRASVSSLSRLAEFLAPQRKFALAPAILAGFAALTVALLTVGNITGVVEQSGQVQTISSGLIAESAAAPAGGSETRSSGDSSGSAEFSTSLGDAGPPGTDDPGAALAPKLDPGPEDLAAAGITGSDGSSEPAETALAPVAQATQTPTDTTIAAKSSDLELARSTSGGTGSDIENPLLEYATSDEDQFEILAVAPGSVDDDNRSTIGEPEISFVPSAVAGTNDGISLPLWQLQVAFAALAIAAIGAWLGLRRGHRD